MSRILGVDPGFKATGYGCIETDGPNTKLLETGTIEPRQKDLVQNRLQMIKKILGELIEEHKPQVLVLEKLYAHYKHPATAAKLGHVRGVICLLSAESGVELAEYSVKRIRKALTGNGNASKVQTKRIVADLLNIDETKLGLDASDALALALGYVRMRGQGA
jgi:crossover junction endodeoxyribonuclease RuvC